ncbi:hypothetical protein DFJ63DRAFT_334179 [Scheffersomyces coipomensis]|uniref:uncharacterized protein n=1 Tax=Scheffersomyces coipomensis TaxID=1788519 RepID=UPI00315CFBA6
MALASTGDSISYITRLGGTRLTVQYLRFQFNVTEFVECVGLNFTDVNLWQTENNDYLIAPLNLTGYDEDLWLDCTDSQGVGDILAVTDGTYVEDMSYVRQLTLGDVHIWNGNRYTVPTNELLAKQCSNT